MRGRGEEMVHFGKSCVKTDSPEKTHRGNTPSKVELPHARESPRHQVVAVDSTVRLKDLDSGVEATFVLTRQGSLRVPQNGLSVSFPLGRAVLGKRVGDTFVYRSSGGPVRIEIRALCGERELDLPTGP